MEDGNTFDQLLKVGVGRAAAHQRFSDNRCDIVYLFHALNQRFLAQTHNFVPLGLSSLDETGARAGQRQRLDPIWKTRRKVERDLPPPIDKRAI